MERLRYAASPRPVELARARYRVDLQPWEEPCYIEYDPRIYHGTTFDRRSDLTEKITPLAVTTRGRTKAEESQEFPAKSGFANSCAQTDDFDGKVIVERNETHVGVQTDVIKERPPVPKRKVAVKAASAKTPVQAIFRLYDQAYPVAQILVQRALLTACEEVAQELELEQMATYIRAFEHKEKVDAEAIARIAKQDQERFKAKEAEVARRLAFEASQARTRSKIAARGYAEYACWDLAADGVKLLEKRGFFYDELEAHIGAEVLPWLAVLVNAELQRPVLRDCLGQRAHDAAQEERAAACCTLGALIAQKDQERVAEVAVKEAQLYGEARVSAVVTWAKRRRAAAKERQRARKEAQEEREQAKEE